jgi:hypothetical protein
MYDMLVFASKYRAAIDMITAEKSFKLHKYELDDNDWNAIDDLITVHSVSLRFLSLSHHILTSIHQSINTVPQSSWP